jgi:dipeptide transport system ATP-binding protein
MMLSPAIVVADEPTSALDVSIQAQVLNLFMELQETTGTAYVFISHNLAVVQHVAHDVMVMYLGRAVEQGPKAQVLGAPLHPYTQALLAAVPVLDKSQRRARTPLLGETPSPLAPPSGCAFHTRCPRAQPRCKAEAPPLRHLQGRQVACHFADV